MTDSAVDMHEMADPADGFDIASYDEFGLLRFNAEHGGLPYAGPPPARRVGVDGGDGHQVSAILWGSSASSAVPGEDGEPKPSLVFLHGRGQNSHTWDTVLLGLDLPALAIDLPGHGHSDWREDKNYSPPVLADAVAAAIRAFASPPVFVVGMSMGGMTTMALAARHPQLVSGGVIVDITPGTGQRMAQMTEAQKGAVALVAGPASFPSFDALVDEMMRATPDRTRASLARGAAHNAVPAPDGTWAWRYDQGRGASFRPPAAGAGGAGSGGAAAGTMAALWDDLSAATAPLTLVRAGASFFTHDDDVAEFLRRKPGTPVHVVAGSGHSVQSDRPNELVAIIREAMAGL
ncbi:MAG: alpha/beta hydrolase [Frankiaceae bacterium]|jgi:pimeloyl-ACP methyl ester carboxylesterase|nr:alpha/beta hydrolase [Frankiaceae bacterium]